MGITKTDFMRGMQCRKMLWPDKHKPSLKVMPPEVQQRLDAGNDFGDRAFRNGNLCHMRGGIHLL